MLTAPEKHLYYLPTEPGKWEFLYLTLAPNKTTLLARAAREVFAGDSGELLLQHLADFCHADAGTFVRDSERMSCFSEGQRSVYLHIKQLLNKEES